MFNDLKKELGNKITELRKYKNLTQDELALKMGYTLVGVSQIERGVKFASEKTIVKLCNALECEPKELFNFNSEAKILTDNQKKLLINIINILEVYPEHIESTFEMLSKEILKRPIENNLNGEK